MILCLGSFQRRNPSQRWRHACRNHPERITSVNAGDAYQLDIVWAEPAVLGNGISWPDRYLDDLQRLGYCR
jgi:hypothetical protein